MAISRLRFIKEGFREILCSPGASDVCFDEAMKIMNKANSRNRFGGDGFNVEGGDIRFLFNSDRVEWWVTTTDAASRKAEAEDKALTGSI